MNVWTYSGRVGADAEVKTLQSGEQVVSFRVANDIGFGDRRTTQWVDNSYWGKRAVAVAPYIKKGDKISVSGELKLEEFQARDGTTKAKLSVRVNDLDLAGKGSGESSGGSGGGSSNYEAPSRSGGNNKPPQNPKYEDLDDSIPF